MPARFRCGKYLLAVQSAPPIMPRLSLRPVPLVLGFGLLALALRLVPALGDSTVPATDEVGYLADGLLMLEGLAPGYKHVPNALLNWLVFFYAAIQTALIWLFATDPAVPPLLRPLLAMERALFADYADMNGLRHAAISLQIAVGAVAAGALAWRGRIIAGLPGALLAGALAAATPIFIEFAVEARAYSLAWSFAMLAFAALTILQTPARTLIAGALMGIAIATRIEMGLALIPLLFELMQREEPGRRRAAFFICLGSAIVVFLAVAPWYVTSLAGNLRQIISVRLLSPPTAAGPGHNVVLDLLLGGLGLPIALTILGLLLTRGRGRFWGMAIGVWIALLAMLALKPSVHGLRHDGALLLLAAVMAPVALARLMEVLRGESLQRIGAVVAALLALQVSASGAYAAWDGYRNAVQGDAVAWIEENVPAGSPVYWVEGFFRMPLPTPESADRLWALTANPDAWRLKYRHAAQRLSLGDNLPRAMSEDPMQIERAVRRRWFILAAPVDTKRPRYDLRTAGSGTPFAISFEDMPGILCKQGGTFVYVGTASPRIAFPPTKIWAPANGSPLSTIALYSVAPPKPGEERRC